MLRPLNSCTITPRTGVDRYSQATLGSPRIERCSIVKAIKTSQHTTVRADSSASRGYADEFVMTNKILLLPTTIATIDSKLEVAGVSIRIKSMHPRYDAFGILDHYEVTGEAWV
jgi:hypothetical protein